MEPRLRMAGLGKIIMWPFLLQRQFVDKPSLAHIPPYPGCCVDRSQGKKKKKKRDAEWQLFVYMPLCRHQLLAGPLPAICSLPTEMIKMQKLQLFSRLQTSTAGERHNDDSFTMDRAAVSLTRRHFCLSRSPPQNTSIQPYQGTIDLALSRLISCQEHAS